MRFVPTRIEGVTIVELDPRRDDRGGFARTFCEQEFAEAGLPFRVVQANLSTNIAALTLRGLHFQRAPHGEPKIVSCLRGRIFDVAVDTRPDSATYLEWEAIEMAPDLDRVFCLGEGIAHGFLTLEPDSAVHYLMGAPYVAEAAAGLRWDDPAIGIAWPASPSIISERDRGYALIGR
ncbi:MAG: dTDP-4-dehydrorhamnose 3,5-epimerase family protein [Allosphingosinicella sp.]